MTPLDILIVEDNMVNQKVLQRQLDRLGNRIHVANHGGEALEALRQSPFWNADSRQELQTTTAVPQGGGEQSSGAAAPAPEASAGGTGQYGDRINISIILMDLEMPVMDGLTCARKIRELERHGTIVRHVPIIAVTAYARPEQIENAKEAGVVSCAPPSVAVWLIYAVPKANVSCLLPGRHHLEALPNPSAHTQDPTAGRSVRHAPHPHTGGRLRDGDDNG